MNIDEFDSVENMTHNELYEEYDSIGNEIFFGTLPEDEKRDALYERRLELWNEMKSRVSVSIPDCPKCNHNSWSQVPGDPKICTHCGFEAIRNELIGKIDRAWENILHP